MVFPSVPIYLDPSNWKQQQSQTQPDQAQAQAPPLSTNTNTGTTTGLENHAVQIQLPPVNLTGRTNLFAPHPSSLNPNRVQHAEPGLKCPRCNSTNTKFCYFNNYSLSQPRHFCRSCRRYWTRGGTLRNVPVGGGSRRNNKRNKSSSSNATSARTSSNMVPAGIHQIGVSSFGANLGAENLGFGFSGVQMQMQLQQQQFPFTVPMQMAGTINSHLNLNSRNDQSLDGTENGNGTGSNAGTWNIGLSGFNTSSSGNLFQ